MEIKRGLEEFWRNLYGMRIGVWNYENYLYNFIGVLKEIFIILKRV